MTDSYLPVLKEVVAALRADSTLSALVNDRVFSDVPDNETFPYVFVMIDSVPYDTKDTPGMEHTVQINVYSRKKEPKECGDIRAAVYETLNRSENIFTDAPVVNIHFNGVGPVVKDQDGVTWFGVLQFRTVVLD